MLSNQPLPSGAYLCLAHTFMVEIFRENAGSTVRKWCLTPEFPAAEGGVADAQMLCCRICPAELLVLCRNLSLPRKRPLFSAQALLTACRQVENVRVEQVLGEL